MFCLCLFCPPPSCTSLPCPPLLSPHSPLSHTRCTSTCCITCTRACMHTHAPLACHSVGPLISSSLVVLAPFFSAFNSPSCPLFTRSLHRRPWPQPTELSIQPFSSWMQILECDKSFWFLSCHFAVATESKTLNTAPIVPQLFTEPSMHPTAAAKMHTRILYLFYASGPYCMHVSVQIRDIYVHLHAYTDSCLPMCVVSLEIWSCVHTDTHFFLFKASVSLLLCRDFPWILILFIFPNCVLSLVEFHTKKGERFK